MPAVARAVLFDLDGTIIQLPNQETFFDGLLVDVLREHDVPIPEAPVRLAIWHSGGQFESILRSWGVRDYDAFIRRFDDYDLTQRRRLVKTGTIHPFPDVAALATLHKRAKLGIVTNTPPEIASFELAHFKLGHHFDDVVMLGTVEQHIAKPEPDGLLRCLRNLRVPESQAVMVGDSSSDIIAGQRAAIGTVLVRRPNQPAPRNLATPPDLVIDDLHQLLRLLPRISADNSSG
jgi:HAD superfamily hydrolase (TIGR01509 family)